MVEKVGRAKVVVVALIAFCAIASLVLAVLTSRGSPAGLAEVRVGRTTLVSTTSGTKTARIQLAGEEDDEGDDEGDEEEPEEPPYGEPTELPDAACDLEALQNCLGAMMAEEAALPEAERALLKDGEDEEIAHEFCEQATVPFKCACEACDLSKLSTWDNDYWTQDRKAKEIIVKMREEARCEELSQMGAANFKPGHGCYNFYEVACVKPLRSDWCPAVLSPNLKDSRYGIAGTMLNDHTKWVNPDTVCKDEEARDRERDCKTRFKNVYQDGNNYCTPMHDFIKCMCNACEYDVESLLKGFEHFGHCAHLERVKNEGQDATCDLWYADECETKPGMQYCEAVEGSLAWQRLQPPEEPAANIEWDEDGMTWKEYCQKVVKTLAESPDQLAEGLGSGWQDWCKQMFGEEIVPDKAPWGSGVNGHVRLPISGMPAPRFKDHVDTNTRGKDPIGVLPLEAPAWAVPAKEDEFAKGHLMSHGDMPLQDQVRGGAEHTPGVGQVAFPHDGYGSRPSAASKGPA